MNDISQDTHAQPGLLAAWLKVAPNAVEEFNDWYDSEHLAQVAGNLGFRSAHRYRDLESEWFVALYELASSDVCFQAGFRDVIANPTPWSRRMAKLYGPNRIRNIYSQILSLGEPPSKPAPFVFIAQMDVPREKEPEFTDWYNVEHAPALAAVPGCLRVRRFEAVEGEPKFMAIYELASPEVLTSEAWCTARELGRTQAMRKIMSGVKKSPYRFVSRLDSSLVGIR